MPGRPAAAAAFRVGASHDAAAIPQLPGVRDWLVNIIPANIFKSASDGEMLPLVIFALTFGFAASRITPDLRNPLLGFFRAMMETMIVIIQWVLWVAPVGVFALALGVGARGGVHAAGALAQYLVLMCALGLDRSRSSCTRWAGVRSRVVLTFRQGVRRRRPWPSAPSPRLRHSPQCWPARSKRSALPERVTSITLPLAVSLFRITSPLFNISIVIFVAHVYGVQLDSRGSQSAWRSRWSRTSAWWACPASSRCSTLRCRSHWRMGVPLELLPLLLAVEVMPDIFRTLGNVTADVAVTAIVAPQEKQP